MLTLLSRPLFFRSYGRGPAAAGARVCCGGRAGGTLGGRKRSMVIAFALLASQRRPHTEGEVEVFEARHRLVLPDPYRQFLLAPGPCKVEFPDRREISFHRLEEVVGFEDFFDDPAQIYREFFPIGTDEQLQEIYALSLAEPTRGLVSRFWHDTVPDDWSEDARWQPLESLLLLIANSGGSIPV